MGQPRVLVVAVVLAVAVALVPTTGNLGLVFIHTLLHGCVLVSSFTRHLDLKLNENKIRIRYTIYKYKSIKLNKMTYNKFVNHSLELFSKIKQNATIQECLNTNAQAAAVAATNDPNESLWFIYYMFFAIHNPKMEDYIQKKTTSSTPTPTFAAAHIIKNMIKRRQHTSTIVFQLYMYAYANEGNVSVIYPKDKDNIANQLIKSFQSNHLKTTAVLLRRCAAAASTFATPLTHSATPHPIHAFVEYIMTTQPTLSTVTTATATAIAVIHKINNHINYRNKDIIILALTCYMKIDEDDINKKNIFISATPEEENFTNTTTTTETTNATDPPFACPIPFLATSTEIATPYDDKYKYLYS
jgi:hypothetical protein